MECVSLELTQGILRIFKIYTILGVEMVQLQVLASPEDPNSIPSTPILAANNSI